ncbi:SDR family oxidoreductase [Nocardiopsis gilva YIM 90087]|uniref:SDR family oxidoreductase n=1 Tax=Nocardiopsis gilva YIM 90087 TaxID=1235441 RepID=A0A223S9T2_9ACTN|nr:SDR family oxidoreductase [Nocardiopsis gilva]ASU84852.1 SDR family oxidoreductase [Nocardiopsis gilva YIM 90087]
MTHVVVSGGGTGIGLAVAERFASSGAQVTILGRREAVLQRAAERIGAEPVVCDVADPAAVAAALPHLPETVDVLVNNAGGNTGFDEPQGTDGGSDPADGASPHGKELAELAASWRRNIEANLISAVLLTTAVRPRLASGGRVVTLGSIAARTGAASYGAAKAAIEAWTVDLAAELGPGGITANVVSPGLISGTEFFRGHLSDEREARLVAATATGRPGTTDDVAALIAFLASPEAGHITGQVLHVNGGAYLGR